MRSVIVKKKEEEEGIANSALVYMTSNNMRVDLGE